MFALVVGMFEKEWTVAIRKFEQARYYVVLPLKRYVIVHREAADFACGDRVSVAASPSHAAMP